MGAATYMPASGDAAIGADPDPLAGAILATIDEARGRLAQDVAARLLAGIEEVLRPLRGGGLPPGHVAQPDVAADEPDPVARDYLRRITTALYLGALLEATAEAGEGFTARIDAHLRRLRDSR